jgi:glycosyltransferase involved in cell wall biosynthesis
MKISTFLPHVGVFGGVRRFLELGNAWSALGARVTLYTPEGRRPEWLRYSGQVLPLAQASEDASDLAVSADPHTYGAFRSHRSDRHLYYCVIEGDPGAARAAQDSGVQLAANSGRLCDGLRRRFRRPVLDGIGGISLEQFHPAPNRRAGSPLRVLLNGRRSRPKKGTDLVLRALDGLPASIPAFEVVLFDAIETYNRQDPRLGAPLPTRGPVVSSRFVMNPSQSELVELYQSSDVFVAAERKAGWCNTALEAMACGVAVACTTSGTRDFARNEETALVVPIRHPFFLRRAIVRLLRDSDLRARLANAGPGAAAQWTWDRLARKLLDQLGLTNVGPVELASDQRSGR